MCVLTYNNEMTPVLTLNGQGNWKCQDTVVICYDLGWSRLHTGGTVEGYNWDSLLEKITLTLPGEVREVSGGRKERAMGIQQLKCSGERETEHHQVK